MLTRLPAIVSSTGRTRRRGLPKCHDHPKDKVILLGPNGKWIVLGSPLVMMFIPMGVRARELTHRGEVECATEQLRARAHRAGSPFVDAWSPIKQTSTHPGRS